MIEGFLGKGNLHRNISRSHWNSAQENKVLNAVWWENVGHFQITYWFNIEVNRSLGEPIDDATAEYEIIHSDLCLPELKKLMSEWIIGR